ncbi:MAG: L-glutamate gamma-semialdehyde dehydrogenase [Proteobacteria bacterium]|nr:L-glutamate gamma-semialdehyde dehydrogenase [Pseudomonadota bacterium]MCP4917409.1 L-glutamate gamma-semialdehyde dehydrogenase [Pseudomonadota bacterium]
MDGTFTPPAPSNEPVSGYAPGSAERRRIVDVLGQMESEVWELPNWIGGQQVTTSNAVDVTMPCDHQHVIGRAHFAGSDQVNAAIDNSLAVREEWAALPWSERAGVFLKAAALLAGPFRERMNASTMLGQGKTVHQAEIDASCELIDFFRFNVQYAAEIYGEQPPVSPPGLWNRLDHRGLEGFVFSITPFNFTSICANLPASAALMGNVSVWKPSRTQAHSAQVCMELFEAAGLPPGVINLVHGAGADVGDIALTHRDLAGVHFTGSTGTFQHIWKTVGANIADYRTYPRLVGETGGKDFIVAHPSADVPTLAVAIARGSFEYQGQKCSASSRVYVPRSLWPEVRDRVVAMVEEMKLGDVRDFSTFVAAVIDERAFDKHARYLDIAKETANVVVGGGCDKSTGWFVEPTVVEVSSPDHVMLKDELFGPIVTVYVYDDTEWEALLPIVDITSPYALTGAIFATDRRAIHQATLALRNAAGNFYINDKPTGAVVGQQPFGGGRASGTNDKAGSKLNLYRWVSAHTIKENFNPPTGWRYPYLG